MMVLIISASCTLPQEKSIERTENDIWVRPEKSTDPFIWGHKKGIRIGLPPMPGPRGLIRIYAPYLGQKEDKMINFIAIEPIVKGEDQRGFSELEKSEIDGKKGKILVSSHTADRMDFDEELSFTTDVIENHGNTEILTFFIHCEPFTNGASVYLQVRFYSDKPYEVELASFVQNDSEALDHLVLTATMGNYARLRNLYLSDTTLSSLAIWPEYKDSHFTDHYVVSNDRMIETSDGQIYFVASTDEQNPGNTTYSNGTNSHWRYYGEKATQYWRVKGGNESFQGLVNGRYTYWASESPIPGGISYENFELKRPFENGQVTVFGVQAVTPEKFIKQIVE
ncbi:MAG: hypothetical protein AAFQ94_00885 [Bacteroidota bacterium]